MDLQRHGKWKMEPQSFTRRVRAPVRFSTNQQNGQQSFLTTCCPISLDERQTCAHKLSPHTCQPQVSYLRLLAAGHLVCYIRLAPWANYLVPFISKGPSKAVFGLA